MERTINIEGLDRAAVFAALYNAAKPQGLGFLHYDPEPMTVEIAQRIIDEQGGRELHLDYVRGRVMKCSISETEVNIGGYDRDNGEGATELVIATLRGGLEPNNAVIQTLHAMGVSDAKVHLQSLIDQGSSQSEVVNGVHVFHLGIDEGMADKLKEKLD